MRPVNESAQKGMIWPNRDRRPVLLHTHRRLSSGMLLETVFHPFLRRLRELPIPLITAVNGAAAGVGMSFALMGDLVLCARSAYFLQAFRRIGLVPDGGSTWLLPRLIGKARASELSLLGEKLPADKALEWGLVNRVIPDDELMGKALEMGRELAAGPTIALGLIRRLYWESPDNTYEEQLDLRAPDAAQSGFHGGLQGGRACLSAKAPGQFQRRLVRVVDAVGSESSR